jgi:hypothetical protein
MKKGYFVERNAKVMAFYYSLKCALNYVARKGWRDDYENSLYLFDSDGEFYDPHNGNKIDFSNIK